MGQKLNGRKKSVMFSDTLSWCCLIKNLARKTHWEKTIDMGKRVQRVSSPPLDYFS